MTPVFLINLDKHQDRLTHMTAQLQKAKMAFERVPGVLGAAVPHWLSEKFLIDGEIGSKLSPGEVGCYASHLVVYKEIIDRQLTSALVLEDDVILDPDLPTVVARVLDSAPAGWDIIKLCNRVKRAAVTICRLGNHQLVRYMRQPLLTCGYLVSAAGAAKMLKPGLRRHPIDVDMRMPWEFGLEVFGVIPEPVKVMTAFGSAITEMGGRGTELPYNRSKIRKLDRDYLVTRVGHRAWLRCAVTDFLVRFLPRGLRSNYVVR